MLVRVFPGCEAIVTSGGESERSGFYAPMRNRLAVGVIDSARRERVVRFVRSAE
jgi:hypothetical protein